MMTRDCLESLGMTDAELDRRYGEAFGGGPVLVGNDTERVSRAPSSPFPATATEKEIEEATRSLANAGAAAPSST